MRREKDYTDILVNGLRYRDPYPNNTIPANRLDPVALKVQEFIPLPNRPGLTNNYVPNALNPRVTQIPSVKIARASWCPSEDRQ